MKRLFLPGLIGMMVTPALVAQQNTYLWTGNTFFSETNVPPPQIDAINFVVANGAFFGVDLSNLQLFGNTFPYTTTDTLNVTNYGFLEGIPGFDFEYFPVNPPPPQPGVPFSNMAGSFANIANGLGGGEILCGNIFGGSVLPPDEIVASAVPGLSTFKVNATNILNSGSIEMDNNGLIDLRGQDLDLRRGQFTMTSGFAQFDIFDWGSGGRGTNTDLNGQRWLELNDLVPPIAISPEFISSMTRLIDQMVLVNATPYFESVEGVRTGPNNIMWRGVFLQDNSLSNVVKNVYFAGTDAAIEWVAPVQDPVTGAFSTNYLYLIDFPEERQLTNYTFALPPVVPINPLGSYELLETTAPLGLGIPAVPSFPDTSTWSNGVINDFAYINLRPTPTAVTNEIADGSTTNVPGRIELRSSRTLQLANTRISGPYYTLISSPVDFEGNSNAVISTPFADLDLGITGQSFSISNLLNPNVPIWTGITTAPDAVFTTPMGGLQAFSTWFQFLFTDTNVTPSITITNDVYIMLVNSAVQPTGPAFQQNVHLHTGHDLVISDVLNIFNDFSSDAQVLTITTNGPGAFSPDGQMNFFTPNIFWSTSLPNLQYFTNWGSISNGNLTVFAGNMTDPYSNPDAATPYQAFINHGGITNNGGTFIRANNFENSGVIDDEFGGSIDIVTSGNAQATNGLFLAPFGYVSITANSLLASNGIIEAGGGRLALSTPCSLSDGYVLNNQFGHVTNSTYPYIVTNGNTWLASGGVQITTTPTSSDLLGTTIENFAFNNFVSQNVWPGQDRGVDPQGFGNNLALGRMMLDSDDTSVFNFQAVNGGGNALYVDSIEFSGNTTNTDPHGNPLSIAIEKGMNIYYAQALENGVSIAEKLNGKFGGANTNGGQFFWVSNYAGVYSSTNIFYKSDGNTYIFNEALAISPDIASGGPDGSNTGIANINNPEPIPTNQTFDITISAPPACDPPVAGSGGPGGTNNPPSPTNITVLRFPAAESNTNGGMGGAGISFSVAQGSYSGLFYDTNGVNPTSAGSFTAKVTSKGNYSAKVQLGKGVYSFSGVFDASGHVASAISGKGLAMLNVDLQLNNNDQIIGSVSGNGWTAQLLANRGAVVSNKAWVGKKTLLLPCDSEYSTTNTGEGYGKVNISANGGVQWSGVLPDGLKLSQKSALSQSGVWPVYSSLYDGSGVFIGWIECTNQPGSDLSGSAVWVMPPGHGLYPPGLTNRINAVGSAILGSVGSPHVSVVLSGGALDQSLTNKLTIFGKLIQGSDRAWKMSVNPQTGLFNGSVADPNSGQKLSFQGAFLERSGTGGGFFLNADQSGKVYFGPAN